MSEEKVLVTNRAALHEYHILDSVEAGTALQGTEVKSVRAGQIQLKESYVSVRDGEAWLFNAHISPYSHGNRLNHDPRSEEHTSELQSRQYLVCRLLLEKKKPRLLLVH